MRINGKLQRLEVRKNPKGQGWGVYTVDFAAWLSAEGGHTTDLSFHGRIFTTETHAQAFVQGYDAAIAEVLETFDSIFHREEAAV